MHAFSSALVASGHVTKMAVTPFNPLKTCILTSWLYVLQKRSCWGWKFYIVGI